MIIKEIKKLNNLDGYKLKFDKRNADFIALPTQFFSDLERAVKSGTIDYGIDLKDLSLFLIKLNDLTMELNGILYKKL